VSEFAGLGLNEDDAASEHAGQILCGPKEHGNQCGIGGEDIPLRDSGGVEDVGQGCLGREGEIGQRVRFVAALDEIGGEFGWEIAVEKPLHDEIDP